MGNSSTIHAQYMLSISIDALASRISPNVKDNVLFIDLDMSECCVELRVYVSVPITLPAAVLPCCCPVRCREAPLTCYVFTTSSKQQQTFTQQVLAGSMCINDCVVHFSSE